MNASIDDSVTALAGLLSLVLIVALYVWTALALSAMFRKMGDEPWKGWVPILNIATVLRWGGFSPWLALLALVPIVGIVVWFLVVISAHRINPGFGYGGAMTVLAALLFVVWASILGFGPARWLGARALRAPAPSSAPAASAPVTADAAAPFIVTPTVDDDDASSPFAGPTAMGAATSDAASDARDDAASFAPPTVSRSDWTPPETAPQGAGTPGTGAPASIDPRADAGRPSGRSDPATRPAPVVSPGASLRTPPRPPLEGDAAWPSEVDDVSAIHPSPFPPSSAAGRPFVAPTMGEEPSAQPAPIAFVPGRRDGAPAPTPPAPVDRVPDVGIARATTPREDGHGTAPVRSAPADHPSPARAAVPSVPVPTSDDAAATNGEPEDEFPQPLRSRRTRFDEDADAFPEMSGEVSAVIGSPIAGAPRSAIGAVSAQQRRAETGEPDPAGGPAPARVDDLDDDLDQTVIARRATKPAWELVPAAGSPIPLTAAVVILGRRPSGDPEFPAAQLVAVPDGARTVSKTHARIEQNGESWVVTDLDSTNGVLVRTLMGAEVEVESGGRIDAGERFFLGDEEFHLRRIAP